ncbi:MAG: bifunctional riboflavin kinase/FAD synthetase [Pseudomonadales bacterium]|nr:bifunctional riboflavin kinase/FAD synthetase [Pseudomonadales bacterium]
MKQTMRVFHSPDHCREALGYCVATLGKYDGMHLGHQRILDQVLALGRQLGLPTVVILSEPQPEEFFKPTSAPVRLCPFDDKVEFLAHYGLDAVLRMEFDAALSQQSAESFASDYLGERLGARALVVGDDFRFGRQRGGDFMLLQRMGTRCGFTAYAVSGCLLEGERVSSSAVREYLARGDCARVARLLGRPFSLRGEIVRGRQLGRQLDMPTANVALHTSALPLCGIYVVEASVNGVAYPALASIGYKPTVSVTPEPSLEVHLLDFSADLYGRIMTVHFLHKLRDEQKFADLAALRGAMAADLVAARDYWRRAAASDLNHKI